MRMLFAAATAAFVIAPVFAATATESEQATQARLDALEQELMALKANARFEKISAISAGVKEIRKAVEDAHAARDQHQQATILFIDEVHRFNKSQQDVFLPFVEDGTFILIGATTENPSFELNSALLSRTRVYVLKRLTEDDLLQVIKLAMTNAERGLGAAALNFPEDLPV